MSAPGKAVFLSYASQDAAAARQICEALRAAGVEVWFDQSELRGGDAWDAKIRRQIKDCALFVPVISAHTQARPEGYFRLEWKLAVDRSHLMADDQPFIVPVVIDDIPEGAARVPDRFRDVQWTRLVLTETPTAFAQRMETLLNAGTSESWTGSASRAPVGDRGGRKERASFLWTKLVPFAGVVVGMLYATQPFWSSKRSQATKPPAKTQSVVAPVSESRPPAAKTQSVPAPVSESRQLMAKAQALYEPWDGATRDDFAAAEQYLKRATELAPTDGEVWAAYALLTCGQIILGHDRSPARIETARVTAERAIRFAPESNQARFAQAFYFRFQPATQGDAERLLRELVERMPADRLVLRTYAAVLRGRGKYDEAIVVLDCAAALPGGDSVAVYNKYLALMGANRFAEAEAVIDQALVAQPKPYFYRARAANLMLLHGNLDGAAEMIAKVPAAFLLEDTGAFWASQIWLWRREADKCIAVWRAVSRDLIETSDFHGPKSFIVGQAHTIAGRPAAAQAEWGAALRQVEQQLATQPNARHWIYWKTRLLASLGRAAEAEESLAAFEQLTGAKGLVNDTIPIYLLLGRRADVIAALEKGRASLTAQGNPGLLARFENNLRLNVEWDLLRDEPRFKKLIGPATP